MLRLFSRGTTRAVSPNVHVRCLGFTAAVLLKAQRMWCNFPPRSPLLVANAPHTPKSPKTQVVSIKNKTTDGSKPLLLVLSDGTQSAHAMLNRTQRELITSGKLAELCTVRLTDYIVNPVQSQK